METNRNLQPQPKAHVLLLPFPVQGHIKPLLTLAQLLCHAGIHVTFVNTEHNHRQLTQRQALSARFPTLHFLSISDGLPSDHPRSISPHLVEIVTSLKSNTKPLLHQLLLSLTTSCDELPPLSCVITDGLMSFAIDAAEEVGLPVIAVRTSSACSLWCYLNIPKLIDEAELPFGDDDMDKTVSGVPGIECVLRRRDLVSVCRMPTDHPIFKFFMEEHVAVTRASGLILNTIDDLESSVLSQIATRFPKVYPIGPLHALLKSRLDHDDRSSSAAATAASLRQEDRRCMTWLESQRPGSVIYVSYGSLVKLTRVELLEFWHGLVNSGSPFLWVIRSDVLRDEGEHASHVTPTELEAGTKERGFIVDWAPQEEVLAHEAVGGFLTHSGWNSTLEAIWAGVPMLCWPQVADQQVNSRWVGEVWKIGIDMKDACDRSTVEKMIKDLMGGEKREVFIRSVDRFSKLARSSVGEGGSSYDNLDKLIQDIKKFVI